ncbi:MAG: DNA-binding response regulator [Bacteroides oleiciplenus]|nr:DNA-binding response regulator [Bacteroides oleiciplenus]
MADNIEERKLKCLIVDDEPVAIDGLILHINKLDFLEVSQTCFSAVEAKKILETTEIDLMFLDINMPYLSGIDFLESTEEPPLTILTTAHSEYALEGYKLNVVDYLLKPIGFQRFFQAASKAKNAFSSQLLLENKEEKTNTNLYVRQGTAFSRILWKDILYIEGMQNYVRLHFIDRSLTIHQTMNSLEQIFPSSIFYRVHRSYIININHIDSVSGSRIFIHNKELPISAAKRDQFYKDIVFNNLISK